MKKLFFFAAVLAASVSANAQFAKFNLIADTYEEYTARLAGTVLATTDAFEASVAFDDRYRTEMLKYDGYGWWEIDGANINAYADTLALRGYTNPKDANGYNPANDCTSPVIGAVYEIVAKADGYLYILFRASSQKQYMVEENGVPIGYHFGMVTTDVEGYFGEVGTTKPIEYVVYGNNELNQITDGRSIMFVEDYIKQENDTNLGISSYHRDGLAVMGVSCKKGSKYRFFGSGTKMPALGVAYYPEDKDIYAVNSDGNKVKIYTSGLAFTPNHQSVQVLVDVDSACKGMGTVKVTGSYYKGFKVILTATPNTGYRFAGWSDGNKEATRVIKLTSDTTLYATFDEGIHQCGSDLYWNYKDNVLRLFGNGAMDITNYAENTWVQYINEIYAISLPEQLTTICDYAFTNAKHLAAITIPAEVVSIGESAFEDCRSMESVTFAGNNVQEIGAWAFYNCHNLSQITIPEGVEEIGTAAFYGCTFLSKLTLPSTTKKIAQNGFALCSKLQTMYVNALVPPTIEAKTFENVDRATPVFVPQGTLERYQADQYWSEFFNMAEYEAPTGNLNVSDDEANGLRKVVRDGQVLIIRGEKTYDMMGQEVK